ncbi:MAG: hypothetical protein CMO55_28305 [Verrucomicrobiales bacterium]|nr:hypothetical protein [Verrucomicrobiales bacterium]
MEILSGFLSQLPIILASIFFCVAAITKLGKEGGAGLVLLGAIGMCALSLVSPIFYTVVVPRLMENGSTASVSGTMRAAAIFFGLGHALNVVFIAVGTLVRKPSG